MRDFTEFFCGGGMGGVGLGPGWRCMFANEIFPIKGASFRANSPGVDLHVADVGDLRPPSCADAPIWLGPLRPVRTSRWLGIWSGSMERVLAPFWS